MSEELKERIRVAITNGDKAEELIALLNMIADLEARVAALEAA